MIDPIPTAADIFAAFERSAELLDRIGGVHSLSARFLRGRLAERAAPRAAKRTAAIASLRVRWFRDLSDYRAAREIWQALTRYAGSSWKRDQTFSQVRQVDAGGMNEALFSIVRLGEGDVPSLSTIRRILADAERCSNFSLEMNRPPRVQSSRGAGSVRMAGDIATIDVVRRMPGFAEAEARAIEGEIADRQQHLAAIAKLDAEALKAWPKEERRKTDAIAKVRQCERDLALANKELSAVSGAVASERFARESARRAHEAELLKGDWSLIDEFQSEIENEIARVRKSTVTQVRTNRNAVTGAVVRQTFSNSASVRERLQALMASYRAAPELRLLADRRELPTRIAEIRAAWPPVLDIPAPAPEAPKTATKPDARYNAPNKEG